MNAILTEMPRVALTLPSTIKTMRDMMRGILEYAQLHGPWAIQIIEARNYRQPVTSFCDWRCMGLIGSVKDGNIRRRLAKLDIPIVAVNEICETTADESVLKDATRHRFAALVECDNKAIGRLAAQHFLKQGYAHFAYVGDACAPRWSVDRGTAFAGELGKAGCDCSVYPLAPRNIRDKTAPERRFLAKWLSSLPPGTALFVGNDLRGRQVLDICSELDIAIPERLAILACDNDEIVCETSSPRLSSIAVRSMEAGVNAAKFLDDLLRGKHRSARPKIITYGPSHVVDRESSARIVPGDALIRRALELIRLNADTLISVEELSHRLKVSRRLLEIHFKKALGHTVKGEMMRLRLERARDILIRTNDSFETIAFNCGFSATSHFSTAFKRQFGTAPSVFRRRAHQHH